VDSNHTALSREEYGETASTPRLLAEIERLKSELERAYATIAELEARAERDPLLEILNRRGFERELVRSIAYVRRYGSAASVMFIDLDGFKAINDRYGHAAGDALLRAVTASLVAHIRASDVVARLGGDEFGILMWNLEDKQADNKARELELLIEQVSVAHERARLSVGASVGVVALGHDAEPAHVIDAADKAMYARKKARRL
jgi:diguanylate cyclase (GGDEF)-like protein